MGDFATVAQQFVEFYYNTFDTDRSKLASLYRESSMLTFEGQQFSSIAGITEKLTSLPFQKVQHKISTFDPQPSVAGESIIISVTGLLAVDEESNPLGFSQTFFLAKDAAGYYVHNDIFRLNLG
ncbi:nuclear transport factor 2 [Neoconidiobolus thromboides FSU 785]|nr:nuclear transport factor 2 [Neoconidiobolus thromboides FSU 785]